MDRNNDEVDAIVKRFLDSLAAKQNEFFLRTWDTLGVELRNSTTNTGEVLFLALVLHIYGQRSAHSLETAGIAKLSLD